MKMTTNQETPKAVSKPKQTRELIKPGFENEAFDPRSDEKITNNSPSKNDQTTIINGTEQRSTEYLKEFADLLKCHLCKGYLIDAISLAECTHNFCRSCILKYLEQGETSCPKCQKEIHKTRPKQCVRTDTVLQEIVYKLVPNLYKNEMLRRREFYKNIPLIAKSLSKEEVGESCEGLIFSTDDHIQLTIEYFPDVKCPIFKYKTNSLQSTIKTVTEINGTSNGSLVSNSINNNNNRNDLETKRYLKCPAEMHLTSLVKLLRRKFSLDPRCQIEFFFKQELLKKSLKMIDLAYIYSSNSRAPIPLFYIVIEPDKSIDDYLTKFSLSEPEFIPLISTKQGIKRKPSTNSDEYSSSSSSSSSSKALPRASSKTFAAKQPKKFKVVSNLVKQSKKRNGSINDNLKQKREIKPKIKVNNISTSKPQILPSSTHCSLPTPTSTAQTALTQATLTLTSTSTSTSTTIISTISDQSNIAPTLNINNFNQYKQETRHEKQTEQLENQTITASSVVSLEHVSSVQTKEMKDIPKEIERIDSMETQSSDTDISETILFIDTEESSKMSPI